jgi:precorrin-6x reductase
MKKPVFWLIAGTTEGRKLAEQLSGCDVLVYVSLATEYGKWFLQAKDNLKIIVQRLNQEEMLSFIKANGIDCVIDASHPYAREVTQNIYQACGQTETEYLRLLRPKGEIEEFVHAENFIYAESYQHAAEILSNEVGRIFLTCGSKEIGAFSSIPNYAERVYLRILPDVGALEKCLNLGFKPTNIICMQGPFSTELNLAMLKQIQAEVMVTKDSGLAGGFQEKIDAANMLGLKIIVISRPIDEAGYNFDQLIDLLKEKYKLKGRSS